jgi:hypothetical protein
MKPPIPGLLSPDLAAGIRRVSGAKCLGVRIGNWLTADQSKTLLGRPPADDLPGKPERAILALLIGCGLRRDELKFSWTRNAGFPSSRGAQGNR